MISDIKKQIKNIGFYKGMTLYIYKEIKVFK
jgi:hypothetical protein